MPAALSNQLQTERPGWIDARLEHRSRFIDSRLSKRYAVPFDETNPPLVVVDWLIALVTLDAYGALGVSVTSEMDQRLIVAPFDLTMSQLQEAADSEKGLFDLPISQTTGTTDGVSRGGPLAYAETSPYIAFDQQIWTGRQEDQNGVF